MCICSNSYKFTVKVSCISRYLIWKLSLKIELSVLKWVLTPAYFSYKFGIDCFWPVNWHLIKNSLKAGRNAVSYQLIFLFPSHLMSKYTHKLYRRHIMWESIQYIGTPVSLIAFVAALIAYAVLESQKTRVKLLESLPEEKRWEFLNKNIEGYNITQDNLTREQKFELMQTVLVQSAEHKKRIIKAVLFASIIISLAAGLTVIVSLLIPSDSPRDQTLKVVSMFGHSEDGSSRVRVVDKSDNNLLLNNSFNNAKSQIRIVTELGNTWLLSDNYQAFRDASDRKLNINILMLDFTNHDVRNLARYSSQKGEGKQGYTPEEVIRGLEEYSKLMRSGVGVKLGSYTEFPWVRFTIFDDSAVSFVLRPMLNISRPQPMYSTDPVIVKMFEGIYREFEKSATIYAKAEDLENYISRYKASLNN